MSVNGQDVSGKTPREVEAILKSLPRGEVKLVAMVPPRDVTDSGMKHNDTPEGVIKVKVSIIILNFKPLCTT